MKVLVTGGGGFLGSAIVRRLLAEGHAVRSFSRSRYEVLERAGVDCLQGSLDDAEAVREAVRGCQSVFHVAALAGIWGPRAQYEATNLQGALNVLEACRQEGVSQLIHTSTPSVVFDSAPITGGNESLPYASRWLCDYARTKAAAERQLLAAHDPKGLGVLALRPHLIWGEGDPHLLPRLVARARAGRLFQVGDGSCRVDITHVEHAAEAHLLAWKALREGRGGGRAYFLSDGEPVRLWEWIGRVLSELGLPAPRGPMPARLAYRLGAVAEGLWSVLPLPGEPPMTRFLSHVLSDHHYFDISAAKEVFGYRPQPTEARFQAMIAQMLEAKRG